VVDINYVSSGTPVVRAFAVEVNVDNGFTISAVTDYNTGESSALTGKKKGYGIFPGSFRDVINPADPCWADGNYKPVAPATDVDASGTGIGTHKVILELGSLYVGSPNQPPASGTLCKLVISTGQNNTTTGFGPKDCNMQITVSATRGGVVLEDGTTVNPTLVARGLVAANKVSFPECFPCWAPYDTQYNQYIACFKPRCWCGWQTNDANWRVQCLGDADNKKQDLAAYRVFGSDYSRLVASWGVKATVLRANPNPLMTLCADFDHKSQELAAYRVYNSDYTLLTANWGVKETVMKPWCPR
jgi:hypothetical protein